VITVDGPSGSGKSTVSRRVAAALGWRYVDTGATYRAATLAVLRAGTPLDDAPAVAAVVAAIVERSGLVLRTSPDDAGVCLDGEDVSAEIRRSPVTSAVSAVSAVPEVRRALVALQRAAIGATGAVAEGRDVGTVVVPDALVKVYLDADTQVRAARRAGDVSAGVSASESAPSEGRDPNDPNDPHDVQHVVAAVAADLARRDRFDSTRADSPLRPATEAVHLDATAMTADEVVAEVLQLAVVAGVGVVRG
jgi:cytidylate kinase